MIVVLSLIILQMLAMTAEPHAEPAERPALRQLLPGLRVGEGVVEFDGVVAVDAHHPDTPDVYLEMLVTAPDSREHESLVVAKVRGSNLHAALLAAGFASGEPLHRNDEGEIVPARGDPLRITVSPTSDPTSFVPITDWVVRVGEETPLIDSERWEGLVFAGSRLTKRGYEADGTGTLISLTSFGHEVVAPSWTVSHLAEIDEPVWIANRDLLPARDTPVVVRIERYPAPPPEGESHQPDGVNIDRDP